MDQGRKTIIIVVAVLVVLLLGVYLWKDLAVRSVEKKMEVQRLELAEQAQKMIQGKTRYFLRLATVPLVWTIRQEMLRENTGQINDYLIQYVREPGIKQILIAKPDGTITAATNKKHEGLSFSSLYLVAFLEKTEIFFSDGPEGQLIIVAPLMGYNEKLGILLMVYEQEALEKKE